MRQSWAPLLFLSLLVHFVFLTHPSEVVFDEVHWGKFISGYCCSFENFFDVHPPHGKLFVAAAARLSGYKGNQNFQLIGTPYTEVSALTLRFLPALMGALVPIVVYFLLLQLGTSRRIAFWGGLMMTLENGLINQSRIMGLYPFLLFSLMSALLFYLKAEQAEFRKRRLYFSLAGAFCGFAVGFQFTGLVAIALLLLLLFIKALRRVEPLKDLVLDGLVILGSGGLIYLLGWICHFYLLTKPGTGDLFYRYTGHFWPDLIALHKIMFSASYNLVTSHPDASVWWTWPIMKKPIFYWVKNGTSIYFIGNPLVWWGMSALLVVLVLRSLWKPRKSNLNALIPLAGFFIAFLPLTGMHRVLFLYHYLTPLTYAVVFVLVALPENWISRKGVYPTLLVLTVLGFLWIAPVTYGLHVPSFYWKTLPWNLAHY